MNKQLSASQLFKQYKKREILQGVSLHVNSGEVVGLLGPNGAGKTTCFYMVVGLVKPDRGQIFVSDREITYLPMHRRARLGVGYLPQEASIFRKLSVRDNIMAILEIRRDLNKQQQHRQKAHPGAENRAQWPVPEQFQPAAFLRQRD